MMAAGSQNIFWRFTLILLFFFQDNIFYCILPILRLYYILFFYYGLRAWLTSTRRARFDEKDSIGRVFGGFGAVFALLGVQQRADQAG
jgi:hypothetical protein